MTVIQEGLGLSANENGRVEIPNCHRRMFPQFLKDMGCEVGVEVGVYKGDFTTRLCNKGLKVYGIDPWVFNSEYHPHRHQRRQDAIYKEAQKRLDQFSECTLIRKTSMEALDDFEDNSLDFIYIDGHHGLKWVTEDIFEWSKKVRKGGIISGHDYDLKKVAEGAPHSLQVKFAVDAYTQAFNIEKWYVLGSEKKKRGEYREAFRSWFWFKK